MFKGYNDPEIQTPKFVIMKKTKLDAIVEIKSFLKLNFLKLKIPISMINIKLEYCHKKPE